MSAAPSLPAAPQTGARSTGHPAASTLRWVGILLVLALLLLTAVTLVASFFRQTRVETSTIAPPVTRVVADTDTGQIRVRLLPAGQPVQLTRVLHWSFEPPQVSVGVTGGDLSVRASCPGPGVHLGRCSVDLDLSAPPGVALELATRTGDVRVAASGGSVTATSDTGDVSINAIRAGRLRAGSHVGDITVIGGAPGANVEARTSTGDVTVSLIAAPALALASTSTGDVTLTVPPGQSYQVEAHTTIGDTTIAVPIDRGAPRRMVVTSSTGDVRVVTR